VEEVPQQDPHVSGSLRYVVKNIGLLAAFKDQGMIESLD
jgi:hypothetical protein